MRPTRPGVVSVIRESDIPRWTDKAVDAVFEAAGGAGTPLSPGAVTQLVQLLAPRVSLAPSLAATVTEEGAALVRLTEFKILKVLSGFPHLGVSGGAGRGRPWSPWSVRNALRPRVGACCCSATTAD